MPEQHVLFGGAQSQVLCSLLWLLSSQLCHVLSPAKAPSDAAELKDKFHISWEKGTQTKETSWKAALSRVWAEVGRRSLWQTHTLLLLNAFFLSFCLIQTSCLLSWSALPSGCVSCKLHFHRACEV